MLGATYLQFNTLQLRFELSCFLVDGGNIFFGLLQKLLIAKGGLKLIRHVALCLLALAQRLVLLVNFERGLLLPSEGSA